MRVDLYLLPRLILDNKKNLYLCNTSPAVVETDEQKLPKTLMFVLWSGFWMYSNHYYPFRL